MKRDMAHRPVLWLGDEPLYAADLRRWTWGDLLRFAGGLLGVTAFFLMVCFAASVG